MRSINLLTVLLAVAMLLTAVYMTTSSSCDATTAQCGDIALSHEEAMEMCEELGLVYDYEAEGYTTYDFCIRPELYNAQHAVD